MKALPFRVFPALALGVIGLTTCLPASERERIFRKFYRAESAARDGAAGTGLGLFIAKELVSAMGGRIWVDSTEGEGSSFSFELPVARE